MIKGTFARKYHLKEDMDLETKRKVLRLWAAEYYKGNPVVTDNKFDLEISLFNDAAKRAGVETFKQIRSPVAGESVPVPKTPEPIGSLFKRRPHEVEEGRYILSLKYDGLTMLLEYDKGRLLHAYTGGDTVKTLDVTANVNKMSSVPQRISCKEHIFVRGECVVSRDNFAKYGGEYKFNRGMVNGALRASSGKNAEHLEFFAFKWLGYPLPYHEELKELKELRFKVVKHRKFVASQTALEKILKSLPTDYHYDGVVLMTPSVAKYKTLGFKDNNPVACFSVKLLAKDQTSVITRCLGVEWNTSKDGNLIPIVTYPTLDFGGKENDRATANNAAWVKERKLGKGSKLKIVQSGDVIPNLAGTKPCKKFKLPLYCKCGSSLEWNGRHLRCSESPSLYGCVAAKPAWLYNYVTKLGFEDIGFATCELMLDSIGITNILKGTKRLRTELLKIEGFGSTTVDNIMECFSKKELPLVDLMVASNLFTNCGKTTLEKYLTLEDYPNLIVSNTNGKTGKVIEAALPEFVKFCKSIGKKPVYGKPTGALLGKQFAFSGYRDSALEKLITDNGGTVGGVTKKTVDLFYAGTSAKVNKAREYGVDTIPVERAKGFIEKLLN